MRFLRTVLLSAVMLGAATPGLAQPRGGHGGFHHGGGFGWGLGLGVLLAAPLLAAPYYYAPPRYAPTYIYPPGYGYPPAYGEPAYAQPAQQVDYWYYCPGSNSYYPYVRQCPEGWQRVSPTPHGL